MHSSHTVPLAQTPLRSALTSLRARFGLDRQIEFWRREVDPTWSQREVLARVVEVVDETHDVKTFILAPNARWEGHEAGQFVFVQAEIDGVRHGRCYSISSPPGNRYIAITVKRVPNGLFSTFMHEQVGKGHVLHLGPASGEFVVGDPTRKLLLIGGGSGITPVMSIVRDLARRNALTDVVMVVAARSVRDVIFAEELASLAQRGVTIHTVLDDVHGRLDANKLGALVPDFTLRATFLCGPAPMMDALAAVYRGAHVSHRLTMERFGAPVATPSAGRRVTLAIAGRTVPAIEASSLLEQLERGGEKPAFGCRMGICNTCRCRKKSGVVENTITGALSSAPNEDIRLCVSRARSDLELEL